MFPMTSGKWLAALVSFYVMVSSGGSLNTFSLISEHIKTSLQFNQEAINTISFFKELGTAAGIVSGVVYGFSGPWLVLLVGAILNLVGYIMIWLSITEKIPHPEVWHMCLYICIVGASVAFTTTAVLVVCANNFPRNQGTILSLLDSTQGLSGATFTLLFQAWFTTTPNAFILLLACFPSALPLAFIFILRHDQLLPDSQSIRKIDTRILRNMLLAVLALAGYLLLVIVLQNTQNLGTSLVKVLFGIMLVLILLPIPVVLCDAVRSKPQSDVEGLQFQVAVQPDLDQETPAVNAPDNKKKNPRHGDDYSIFQAIKSVDMWLIFVATTCGVGAALTVYNNLGQIGISLGYSQLQTSTFVALLSIWDFLGGVGCGFLSDVLLRSKALPRPCFLAIVLGVLALGNLVIGLANFSGALFLGSILVGVSIGAQWAVLYTIIAEIFGLKNYGTLQNFTYVAKALGTYFLSVRLAGILYDREATKTVGMSMLGDFNAPSPNPDAALRCFGQHCYRTTCFIMAAACLLGCFMSTLLTIRTRSFYKDVVRPRLLSE